MKNALDLKSTEHLLRAIEKAKSRKMTRQEMDEQRVSFVYSAMSENSHVTRARVREILIEKEGVRR